MTQLGDGCSTSHNITPPPSSRPRSLIAPLSLCPNLSVPLYSPIHSHVVPAMSRGRSTHVSPVAVARQKSEERRRRLYNASQSHECAHAHSSSSSSSPPMTLPLPISSSSSSSSVASIPTPPPEPESVLPQVDNLEHSTILLSLSRVYDPARGPVHPTEEGYFPHHNSPPASGKGKQRELLFLPTNYASLEPEPKPDCAPISVVTTAVKSKARLRRERFAALAHRWEEARLDIRWHREQDRRDQQALYLFQQEQQQRRAAATTQHQLNRYYHTLSRPSPSPPPLSKCVLPARTASLRAQYPVTRPPPSKIPFDEVVSSINGALFPPDSQCTLNTARMTTREKQLLAALLRAPGRSKAGVPVHERAKSKAREIVHRNQECATCVAEENSKERHAVAAAQTGREMDGETRQRLSWFSLRSKAGRRERKDEIQESSNKHPGVKWHTCSRPVPLESTPLAPETVSRVISQSQVALATDKSPAMPTSLVHPLLRTLSFFLSSASAFSYTSTSLYIDISSSYPTPSHYQRFLHSRRLTSRNAAHALAAPAEPEHSTPSYLVPMHPLSYSRPNARRRMSPRGRTSPVPQRALRFPPAPPLPRSPLRPTRSNTARQERGWRVRPVANPLYLRTQAAKNVCGDNGNLPKERVLSVAFEGIGRSGLSVEVRFPSCMEYVAIEASVRIEEGAVDIEEESWILEFQEEEEGESDRKDTDTVMILEANVDHCGHVTPLF
jgi:hypothetical protein